MNRENLKEAVIGALIIFVCVFVIIGYILAPTSRSDDRILIYILNLVGINI